ncbi:reverse transcriptase [Plakobranchus ocellatus]|uniref:Reverse transcriptase n=1 Tax=Plakobranchus ocellatus TaxID=259542 RepID=A0AAV4BC41_9GAST|nr:reverse transcriptase [Plakobranchus ocellatus]
MKSRSLYTVKLGKNVCFKIASQDIPRISQEPVKSLGRWYGSYLKDTRRGSKALEQASVDLQAIDKCGLPGKYKVWCPVYAYPKALLPTPST